MAEENSKGNWGRISGATRVVLGLAICFVVALFLEATLFNIPFWTSVGLESVNASFQEISRDEIDSGNWRVSYEVELSAPLDLKTMSIETRDASSVIFEISDEGHLSAYEVLEASLDVTSEEERYANPMIGNDVSTFTFYPYGKTDGVSVILSGTSPVLNGVVCNPHLPFELPVGRLFALFSLCAVVFIFRTKSRIFKTRYADMDKIAAAASVFTVVVLVSGVFMLAATSNEEWLGKYIEDENGQIEYVYGRQWHGQYAELAKSLAEGRLSINTGAEELLNVSENPYDRYTRVNDLGDFPEAAIWDTAFYEGKFYVYFGILPVLVFFLPYYVLTGMDLPIWIPCVICTILLYIGIASVVCTAARRIFRNVSVGDVLLVVVILCLSAMTCIVARGPFIYPLPIVCALALLAWGIRGGMGKSPIRAAVLSSLCFSLMLACRPQIFIFALFFVPFLLRIPREEDEGGLQDVEGPKHMGVSAKFSNRDIRTTLQASCSCLSDRNCIKIIIGAVIPFVIVCVLLGIYNALRFGSPFDFGAEYNLTHNDMRNRPASIWFAVNALFYFLLQFPNVDLMAPYVHNTSVSFGYNGHFISEGMYGGIMWLAPITILSLCLLFEKGRAVKVYAGVGILAVCVVIVFDALGAGLLARYMMDFALPLSLIGGYAYMRWIDSGCEQNNPKGYVSHLRRFGVLTLIVTGFFQYGMFMG